MTANEIATYWQLATDPGMKEVFWDYCLIHGVIMDEDAARSRSRSGSLSWSWSWSGSQVSGCTTATRRGCGA